MAETQQCIFCLGRIIRRYRDCSDRVGKAPGLYSFDRCERCRSLHINPRPSAEALALAYGEGYFTHDAAPPHTPSTSRFLGLVKRALFRAGYDERFLRGAPGRLLDIGCGNGNFLQQLRSSGWQVFGIEPDPVAAALAEAQGCTVFRGAIEDFSLNSTYDAVTIWHVLEHLDNARSLFSKLRGALSPNGVIVS